MIIKNIGILGYKKSRPKSHKLEGITTRQHPGMVLASYPKPYPLTAPQKRIREAARALSRSALVDAMVNCIPGKF